MKFLVIFGAALRLILLYYGTYQDKHPVIKYTDIDYNVFSDAAKYVSLGSSPYERATYRYTPLLAWILVPNTVYPFFGKILFACCDLVVGILIYKLLRIENISKGTAKILTSIWILNPFVAVISTRGNAESIMAALVTGTLYALKRKRLTAAAILFGISVHFKIYPVIYSVPIWFGINFNGPFISKERVYFGLLSFSVFMIFNLGFYAAYGWEFLDHTFLYHLTRTDHRHNFSVYFYHMYLAHKSSLIAFMPQFGLVLLLGYWFASDQELAWFLQTFSFVALNKVSTSQYFLWYLNFLPLVLAKVTFSIQAGLVMLICWVASQAIWLYFAFELEHLGHNTFFQLWLAGIGYYFTQVGIIISFILYT